jgi:RNA polymerase sigma-70 factor (ECF subfamily)
MMTLAIMHKDTDCTISTKQPVEQTSDYWDACLEDFALTGNKAVYVELYDHFAPRLNAWLLGQTKDPIMAEELVQETMLRLWHKAGQYKRGKAAASTWLFRIARNLHVDMLRRKQVAQKKEATIAMSYEEVTDSQSHTPDGERIKREIAKLPVQQAQVIYKSYFEGKSHQEIADDMQIPLGSVKSSIRLAFQKLSKAMRPEEV